MVSLMENSYQQLGGSNTTKFNKGIRQNFKDLKNLQDYSQLEMSRNLFKPSKSKFLSGDLYDEQMEPMEQDIINSKYFNNSVQQNLDLSRSLIKFVENERMRESRSKTLGKEVRNIVSYLQDNEIDSEKLHNISGMLMDEDVPYVSAADKQKAHETDLKNRPKGILKKRGNLPADALEPIAEVTEPLSKKSSRKSKKDKKERKGKDSKKEKKKREKKPKKEKTPKSDKKSKSKSKKESKSKSKGKSKDRSKSKPKKDKKDKKAKASAKDKKAAKDKGKDKKKKDRSNSKKKK